MVFSRDWWVVLLVVIVMAGITSLATVHFGTVFGGMAVAVTIFGIFSFGVWCSDKNI